MTTGFVKEMTVVDLAVSDWDGDQHAGRHQGRPARLGALDVWLGNMWNGVYLQQTLPAEQVELQAAADAPYDLMQAPS